MVFPIETEDRTMRNLLMLCQDHQRMVVEIFRKVLMMIDNLVKSDMDKLPERLAEVEKLHHDSIDKRMTMMKELHETGGMLVDREDLYRLINKSGEVMDYIEGIGVRLWQIGDRRWKIPKEVGEGLVSLAEAAFEMLTKLRESLISLGFSSEQAIILTRDVDEMERKVDSMYRSVDLKIVTSEADLPLILILRDITQAIEEMTDKAEEEANLIRILAL